MFLNPFSGTRLMMPAFPLRTRLCGALFACALLSAPVSAVTFAPGDWLERLNMYTTDSNSTTYKQKAYELCGTRWSAGLVYAGWQSAHTDYGSRNRQYVTAEVLLTQRLIRDEKNGGTWLCAAFSGNWGVNKRSRHGFGLGECTAQAAASQWKSANSYNYGIPELSIMQYLNGKQTCVIAGMLNTGEYLDYLCTSGGYANGMLSGSAVLPMTDGNLGLLLQQELGCNNYIQLAFSRTGCKYDAHNNPFRTAYRDGYDIIGEYGHWLGESTEIRLNPFYRHLDEAGPKHHKRDSVGLVTSMDADLSDSFSIFARAGVSAAQQDGASAEFSFGISYYPMQNRPDDHLGFGLGVIKGEPPYGQKNDGRRGGEHHRREYVAELMYLFRVNDYCYLAPHAEYVFHPSYAATPSESIIGMQVIFSF